MIDLFVVLNTPLLMPLSLVFRTQTRRMVI